MARQRHIRREEAKSAIVPSRTQVDTSFAELSDPSAGAALVAPPPSDVPAREAPTDAVEAAAIPVRPPRWGYVLCRVIGLGALDVRWIRDSDRRELPTANRGDVGWFPEFVIERQAGLLERIV